MGDSHDIDYRTPLISYDKESTPQSELDIATGYHSKATIESRTEFGVTVVEDSSSGIVKDVTVVHSDWKSGKKGAGVTLYIPGSKREAVAWQAVHTYFADDGSEMFVCNICGKDLKLSGTAGAISSHLKRRHPGVKEQMEEKEQDTSKKRDRSEELLVMSKKSKNYSQPSQEQQQHKIKSQATSSSTAVVRATDRKAAAVRVQTMAQVMYLIGEGLPFSHIESRWHKHLLQTTVTSTKVAAVTPHQLEVTTQSLTKRIYFAARKLREHLKQRIRGKPLCGATNHWTSRRNLSYVSFSVQWIEDHVLESAVLAVYILKRETGTEHIRPSIMKDLSTRINYWGFGSALKYHVSDRKIETNAFGLSIEKMKYTENIPCLDHLLNLVAKKAFEGALGVGAGNDCGEYDVEDEGVDVEAGSGDDNTMHDVKQAPTKKSLLPRVRKLIAHFEASIQANDELMVIAKQSCASEEEKDALKNLAQDLSTNWWSTQNMLERLFGLREAITTYVSRKWMPGVTTKENRPPRLTEEEWEALEELHFMLRPLRFAQQMLQGHQSNPSASFVPLVTHLIYQELQTIFREDSNNANVKTIAKEMLSMMDKLFGNFASRDRAGASPLGVSSEEDRRVDDAPKEVRIHKAILMAHALDPRFKLLSVFPEYIQNQIWSNLLQEMLRLGPEMTFETKIIKDNNTVKEKQARQLRKGGTTELDDLLKLYKHDQGPQKTAEKKSVDFDPDNWRHICEVELEHYREAVGMEPTLDSDVIGQWWGRESRSSMYPVLWQLAQRVLCINATSTPAHRAFCLSHNSAIYSRCKMGTGDECVHFLYENFHQLRELGGETLGIL